MKEIQIPMMPGMPEDNDAIEGDFHTLFKDEVETKFEKLEVEAPDGEEMNEIYEKIDGYTKYKMFIADFADSGKGTQKIINELQKGAEKGAFLEVHIASNGGVIDELIEYTNIITSFYKDTVTYANFAYSAGAFMFLLGNERVVYEHSSIMFHSWAGGAYGKRDDMLTQIEHTDKRISEYFDKILKPYFTKKERKKMTKGKDFWMNAHEALKRGIATHIIVDGTVKTADEYLNPPKKLSKKKQEAALKKLMETEPIPAKDEKKTKKGKK